MKFQTFAIATALSALIVLPATAQMPQPRPVQPIHPPSASTPAISNLVNINTASSVELDALPGVGKSRAESIIKNRPYKAKDELLGRHIIPSNVYKGIKNKIIARQATSTS